MIRSCLLALFVASTVHAQDRPTIAPADAPAQLRIAARDEAGQPLRITGRVVDQGGAPVAGASLYVYQTDERGYYTPEDAGANRRARLHGYLRSDRHGQFEITTVRPGSYPASRVPQHVHFVVTASGFAERIFEIIFDDDPYVDARVRAQAAQPNSMFSMCKPQRQEGVTECSERIVLSPTGGRL
jgi:protocatechuate 3,4-dioxygenase beta subunit